MAGGAVHPPPPQSCNAELPAPANPDNFLRTTFGNSYMVTMLPPGLQSVTCGLHLDCPVRFR